MIEVITRNTSEEAQRWGQPASRAYTLKWKPNEPVEVSYHWSEGGGQRGVIIRKKFDTMYDAMWYVNSQD